MVELSEDFKLQYEALDSDHQKLVEMVNEISGMLDEGCAEDCKAKVVEFINFTKAHFAREEQLLTKSGYPNVENHSRHHKALDKKMDHLLEFASMVTVNELACDSLKKELVFFVMDDVIRSDLDFKSFLENIPS